MMLVVIRGHATPTEIERIRNECGTTVRVVSVPGHLDVIVVGDGGISSLREEK